MGTLSIGHWWNANRCPTGSGPRGTCVRLKPFLTRPNSTRCSGTQLLSGSCEGQVTVPTNCHRMWSLNLADFPFCQYEQGGQAAEQYPNATRKPMFQIKIKDFFVLFTSSRFHLQSGSWKGPTTTQGSGQ